MTRPYRYLRGDELGWRLSGLIDGEGCFYIVHPRPPARGHRCGMTIGMRSDDRAFLDLMQRSTKLGRLYDIAPSARAVASRPGTNPQTHWKIERRDDCLALVALLDKYPPLSKKAREYELWREAVMAWEKKWWNDMAALRAELMDGRKYAEVVA